jgi:hypothetical protein
MRIRRKAEHCVRNNTINVAVCRSLSHFFAHGHLGTGRPSAVVLLSAECWADQVLSAGC